MEKSKTKKTTQGVLQKGSQNNASGLIYWDDYNFDNKNNTKKYNVFQTKNPYLYESIYDSYIPYKNEQNFTKMTFINEKRLYSLKEKKYVDLNKN